MDGARTLILDIAMRPHGIVSWMQAICLLVSEKVDVLESYDAQVSSPSLTLDVPAVVRLRKACKPNGGIRFSRANVYMRDKFRCCYCGEKKKPRELTYDHVVPRSRGGRRTFENIVTSCRPCNSRKGDRTPVEAGMKMHYRSRQPTELTLQPLLLDLSKVPPQWEPYLGTLRAMVG
jgi:5-methylcytosine-specific restriction endonuclease McrA